MHSTLLPAKCRIFSGSLLKTIAIISMAIDHTAYALYPVVGVLREPFTIAGKALTLYWIMRKIGRLAFPIFCFLIAEGYLHTRNKKRYSLRLLLFAVISEIPFNLMCGGNYLYQNGQNVFFTLFFGLLLIHIFASVDANWKKYLAMSAVAALALIAKADYDLYGALLVFMFYILRGYPVVQPFFAYPLLSGEIYAVAACIPINMYNGQRGYIKSTPLKIAFYAFYPVHMLILVGIRYLLRS